MKKAILFLTTLFLFSCGASKKHKREQSEEIKTEQIDIVKKDVDLTTNTKIENKIYTDSQTKEVIKEKIYSPADTNKPAIFTDSSGKKQELNNTTYTEREITRNKDVKQIGNTNISNDIKATDKSEIQGKKTTESKKTIKEKSKESEQFNWSTLVLQFWWLWLIILGIIFALFRKYKEKFVSLLKIFS